MASRAKGFVNADYEAWRSILPHNQQTFNKGGKEHPTTKPLDIMLRLVEMLTDTDHIVLDPYVGSGTTAVAAKMLNRRYIGVEQNPEYVKLAEKRIAEAAYQATFAF